MSPDNTDSLAFEQAFQKLEEAVQALEKGGLTLDQAMVLYEEGMRMAQVCGRRLDGTELKITELQNLFANGHQAQAPAPESNDDDR